MRLQMPLVAPGGPWPYPSLTAVQVSDFREVSGALDQKSKSLSVGNSVKFQLQFTGRAPEPTWWQKAVIADESACALPAADLFLLQKCAGAGDARMSR